MKKYAVIVAAGSGSRMGKEIPKQFLELGGKPVLCHTIEAFVNAYSDINLILVVASRYMAWAQDIVKSINIPSQVTYVEGGPSRFHSVRNGLKEVKENSVVFVHDGVRCLVTGQLIHRCFDQAILKGSAIPSVAATETVRILQDDQYRMADRKLVRLMQTPQTFLSTILLKAFETEEQATFTDEASVVEYAGEKVHLIEGEFTNIKITRPQDLAMAQYILQMRTGS